MKYFCLALMRPTRTRYTAFSTADRRHKACNDALTPRLPRKGVLQGATFSFDLAKKKKVFQFKMLPLFYDSTFSRSLSHDNIYVGYFLACKKLPNGERGKFSLTLFPFLKKRKARKAFCERSETASCCPNCEQEK